MALGENNYDNILSEAMTNSMNKVHDENMKILDDILERQYNGEFLKKKLTVFANRFNRSVNQTTFLYNLLGCDFQRLNALEVKIKNFHIFYCPGDLKEVDFIMNLNSWYKDDFDYVNIK